MPASCDELLGLLWRISWQAAAIAILVFLLQRTLGRAIIARWRHALWMLVLVRLLLPVLPHSRFSLLSFAAAVPQVSTVADQPFPDHMTTVRVWIIGNSNVEPSASNVPERVAKPPVDQPTLLVIAWLSIAAALFTFRVIVNIRFCSRLKRASKSASARLLELLDRACEQSRIRLKPMLILTDLVSAPAVAGIFRPTILLPIQRASQMSDDDLHLVLLHELTHIKCFDVAIDWLWTLVQSLHWFNPVLWAVTPLRHNDREMARDEMVLTLAGRSQAPSYGQLLIALSQSARLPMFCPGLIGMLAGKKCLQRRVKMIARFDGNRWYATVAGVGLMIAAGCCTLTSPPASSKPPTTSTTASTTDIRPPFTGIREEYRNFSDDPMTDQDRAVQQALDGIVKKDLQFNARPLDEVFVALGGATGTSINVDWPALQRAHVTRDSPVTTHLWEARFDESLAVILRSVEGETPDETLGYTVEQGVIIISTRKELDKKTLTREYDINDLLFIPPNYASAPTLSLSVASTKQTDLFADARPLDQSKARNERVDEIKKYIMDNVQEPSWEDRGGQTGSISVSPERAVLLITQTPRAHRAVHLVLDSLRQSQSKMVNIESRILVISDSTASQLPENVRNRLPLVRNAGRYRHDQFLTDAEVAQFLRVIQSDPTNSSVTAPRLTLFSGQTGALVVQTQQAYVANLTKVVSATDKSKISYQPVVATTTATGLTIKVTSAVGDTNAFIDLHAQLTRLRALMPEQFGPEPGAGTIQRPITVVFKVDAACTIPNNMTLLLGGTRSVDSGDPMMNADSPDRPATYAEIAKVNAADETLHEYLLVKPARLNGK